MSDAELVARTRQGDTAAFEELVTRHRSAVYRAAMAALHSPADAEDAAQDAFLVAYRRLDTFRGRASFKTWLLSIAWHQAINQRRTLTRVWRAVVQPRTNDEADAAIGSLPAADPSPEAAAHGDQLRRAVRDAIRALSPKLRDVVRPKPDTPDRPTTDHPTADHSTTQRAAAVRPAATIADRSPSDIDRLVTPRIDVAPLTIDLLAPEPIPLDRLDTMTPADVAPLTIDDDQRRQE